jgi:hypothetical protein
MSHPTPQRTVTISIIGNDEHATVLYTYLSPITGLSFINAPTCDLKVDRAINTLFVLDYAATMIGWKITKTTPNGTPALEQIPGAKHLSLMTCNPYDVPGETYKYYIHYHNSVTDQNMKKDPQEGNIPPEATVR